MRGNVDYVSNIKQIPVPGTPGSYVVTASPVSGTLCVLTAKYFLFLLNLRKSQRLHIDRLNLLYNLAIFLRGIPSGDPDGVTPESSP